MNRCIVDSQTEIRKPCEYPFPCNAPHHYHRPGCSGEVFVPGLIVPTQQIQVPCVNGGPNFTHRHGDELMYGCSGFVSPEPGWTAKGVEVWQRCGGCTDGWIQTGVDDMERCDCPVPLNVLGDIEATFERSAFERAMEPTGSSWGWCFHRFMNVPVGADPTNYATGVLMDPDIFDALPPGDVLALATNFRVKET